MVDDKYIQYVEQMRIQKEQAFIDSAAAVESKIKQEHETILRIQREQEELARQEQENKLRLEQSLAAAAANNTQSRGFGDTVEKIASATGLKAVVDTVSKAVGVDCGCNKRKQVLNELFPYNQK